MTVGERIKARRKELDISVDELALILDKNRATVYRYESSDIENMPVTVLEPLSTALRTTPAYLMGWDNDKDIIAPSDMLLREAPSEYSTIPKNNTINDSIISEIMDIAILLNNPNRKRLLNYAEKIIELQNEDDSILKN